MFRTKKDVIEYLEQIGMEKSSVGYYVPGEYCCSHGEYDRPDYTPRRYGDGWDIHRTYHYYQGTFNAPSNGRVDSEFYAVMDAI